MSDDLVKRYLLIKRGLYYAPDRQGYTGVKERAGRYREVEALGLDGVTAIHEDEAPDFSPACWGDTKIAVLTARIEALTAEVERLREALDAVWKEATTMRNASKLVGPYPTNPADNRVWARSMYHAGKRIMEMLKPARAALAAMQEPKQ